MSLLVYLLTLVSLAGGQRLGGGYKQWLEWAFCMRRQNGVPLLRVRGHLLRHFSFAPTDLPVSPGVAARAVAAADGALAGDTEISTEALRWTQETARVLGKHGTECRLAGVALHLLHCAGAEDLEGCTGEDVQEHLQVALGADPRLPLVDVLRSLWPLPGVAAAFLARARGSGRGEKDARRLQLLRHLDALAAGTDSHAPDMLRTLQIPQYSLRDILEPMCPYRPPYDFLMCGGPAPERGGSNAEEAWAAAALALVLANSQIRRLRSRDAEQLAEACQGVSHCAAAAVDGEVTAQFRAASEAMQRALEASPAPLLVQLTDTTWPVLELLCQTVWLLQDFGEVAIDGRHGPFPQDEKVYTIDGAVRGLSVASPCACDLRWWPVYQAEAIAPALRVLQQLHDARGDGEALFRIASGGDVQAACPIEAEAIIESTYFETHTNGFYAMQFAWGNDPLKRNAELSVPEQRLFDTAVWLQGAPVEAFGPDVCLPATTALLFSCFVAAVVKPRWSWWRVYEQYSKTFLLGCTQCVVRVPGAQDQHEADLLYRDFVRDWHSVALWWQEDSAQFLTEVLSPLVASDRWWLGQPLLVGELPPAKPVPESLSGCAGLAEPSSCSERAGVVARAPVTAALTRVLGVGLMKAGSTLIVQSLRAATELPMGMDCTLADQLVERVRSGVEPLSMLVGQCSEEVFKWELAKDPMLTPVARQLAASWPALSMGKVPLKMFFFVRNPFHFVRSFLRHLEVAVDGGPAKPQQSFVLYNWPNHERFTRQKQLYLDTQREGLNYTGYVDAAAQRWALVVDEYLRCPALFVLVRYEDFRADPLESTRLLLWQLGLGTSLSPAAAQRVREATALRYQALTGAPSGRDGDLDASFGPALRARLDAALRPRALLLGYRHELGPPPEPGEGGGTGPPLDVPALPAVSCDG